MLQQTIQLQAGDNTGSAYLAAPPNGGPAVLVMHAWWGLTSVFKRVCDRLAEAGFVALAPDLYAGQTASTIDEAMALLKQRNMPTMQALALEALKVLRGHPLHTSSDKVGVIGFSMGGGWAISLASELVPDDIAAVVLIYSGSDGGNFERCTAAFQGHFAVGDEWEPDEGVQQTEEAMRKAGVSIESHRYTGVGHWFFEDDKPDYYNAPAAQLVWERTLAFLRQHVH